ncbi:MAG: hypothetical protein M3Y72_16915 [Acidobacteriota bacterium]|nr:hypothetical protein [Acidobacteriota bacterium]
MTNIIEGARWLRTSLISIVVVHLVVGFWHGAAHFQIPVPLTLQQKIFVGVMVYFLPLVGAGLLWTSHRWTAAWLITLSLLGSLIFGFINHFVLPSPDYVMEVPAHA